MGTLAKDHSSGAAGHLLGGGVDTKKVISGKFTFSSAYATGGESLNISNDLRRVERVIIGSFPVTATVAAVKYNSSTGKLQAYVAAGTEVAASTNLSTVTVEFFAIGLN
jgi:hypothetical protein